MSADEEQFLLKFKDVESAVSMTVKRAVGLEKVFQTQVEDKDVIQSENEDKLKMLIYNLCREIELIFVIFLASPEFSSGDSQMADQVEKLKMSESWQIITQIEKDFAGVRDDELVSANTNASPTGDRQLIFPREANG